MKFREQTSETETPSPTSVSPAPSDSGETLRKASDLADAADEAIRRALSGNSEQFLRSNRQQGGQ